MEDIARELGMSVSGLYYYFKSVTAMSPLASAGFRVGYENPSSFSREYKKAFRRAAAT
jgi:AraC-like DNA-binding protein